jgi:hypothetical protein
MIIIINLMMGHDLFHKTCDKEVRTLEYGRTLFD